MIFLEDRPFFNPYFIGGINVPPNVSNTPNTFNTPFVSPELSPKEIYENQYLYYRCMNEYLDYMMKSKEYDRCINSQDKNKS